MFQKGSKLVYNECTTVQQSRYLVMKYSTPHPLVIAHVTTTAYSILLIWDMLVFVVSRSWLSIWVDIEQVMLLLPHSFSVKEVGMEKNSNNHVILKTLQK